LYGIEAIHVTTMQAISGAGYAGVPSYAILDNVIPYIGGGEEQKIETEPRKILGRWQDDQFVDAPFRISAQVNRVPTIDGHLMTISLGLRNRNVINIDQVRQAIDNFRGQPQHLRLPSAPKKTLHYVEGDDRRQPRLDRDRVHGISVSIGPIRPCPVLDLLLPTLLHYPIPRAA